MADYYPLLAKAVAAQAQSDPEKRHAIYERARKALLGQLRAIQPPVPEPDIQRENQALDDAISRLEAEIAAGQAAPAPPPLPPSGATPRPRLPPRPLPPRPNLRPPIGARPAFPGVPPREAPPAAEPTSLPAPPAMPPEEPAAAPEPPEEGFAPADTAAQDDFLDRPAPAAGFTLPQGRAEPEPPLRPRDYRPAAPRPQPPGRRAPGIWIAGAVAALVVLLVAAAAWKLRDRPEDLKGKPASVQTETGNAKLGDRIGGAPATGARPGTGTPVAPSDQTPTVPVAHRAALLIEAPDEESKVKTFIGSVVWRLENASRDAGQPLTTAVRADVDIPDAKFKVALTFQKNLDSALPASHTISIRFTPLAGSPIGDVQQIDSPQMRHNEAPSGDPLSAVPVPIMDNNFLVGLARGDFENRNLDLIKTRAWIDIPMLLKSKRVAKLTLEKGVTGDRAINDALAAWAGQKQ
jgi:hypothetical protein